MGRTGRRIGNRYRLIERLGIGGMSEVWRGYDEVLGREVAIKVLSPRLAGDRVFRDRMRQEALAAAGLCHPHITGVFDFGESPLNDQLTVPYVVMVLNDGESVSARLSRRGPLGWRDAVTVAAEVGSALATAHAHGIVHRDVTPANVMLTATGARVVDFGISALVGQQDAAPDGSLLGTPAYLAPERLGGAPVSPATDVYALGLLLYRLLTARLPWPAGNTTEALRAHLYADPEPLPSLPGLPADVADLCLRCLSKDPGDRPAAAELATRLGAHVGLQAVVPAITSASAVPIHRQATSSDVRPETTEATLALPGRRTTPGRAPLGVPVPRAVAERLDAARALRLRAGLRLGKALRLGAAKPLGGGLFAGGQFTPGAVSHIARRHRAQAAIATLTLASVLGLVWTSTRDVEEVGPAQAAAAGAGPPVGVRHTARCRVRYEIERDSGADFQARLTVVNTGEQALTDWRMEFAFPGTQRLIEPARAVAQNGRKVVLNERKDLPAGKSVSVLLRGAYRGSNPLPLFYKIDGHSCQAEVLGATTVSVDDPKPTPSSAPASRTPRKAKNPAPASGEKSAKKRAPATPRPTTPPPPAVTPQSGVGFSITA
jgi:serine/threonine-protein kinase